MHITDMVKSKIAHNYLIIKKILGSNRIDVVLNG